MRFRPIPGNQILFHRRQNWHAPYHKGTSLILPADLRSLTQLPNPTGYQHNYGIHRRVSDLGHSGQLKAEMQLLDITHNTMRTWTEDSSRWMTLHIIKSSTIRASSTPKYRNPLGGAMSFSFWHILKKTTRTSILWLPLHLFDYRRSTCIRQAVFQDIGKTYKACKTIWFSIKRPGVMVAYLIPKVRRCGFDSRGGN